MPSVEFSRDILVPAAPTSVWETVTDVHKVASWVSVVGAVEEIERLARYSAVLADRLGPFKLSADLDVEVTEIDEGRSIAFVADGEDRQVASRIRIAAALKVVPTATGSSVDVAGMYEVTGRVASLGASMIRSKGDKILEEFFAAIARELS
jgi:uncharacterized protein